MCVVQYNTEAVTPPQPLHSCGQHGGDKPLRKRLTFLFTVFL